VPGWRAHLAPDLVQAKQWPAPTTRQREAKSRHLDEMISSGKDDTMTMHRFNSEEQ
jgi:hypothetical protein